MRDDAALAAVRLAARWFEVEPDGFGPLMDGCLELGPAGAAQESARWYPLEREEQR